MNAGSGKHAEDKVNAGEYVLYATLLSSVGTPWQQVLRRP